MRCCLYGNIRARDPRACAAMKALEEDVLVLFPEPLRRHFMEMINQEADFVPPVGYREFI